MKEFIKTFSKRDLLFLSSIFLLGLILRFFNLGNVPIGFHRDEAYFAYNAYSIFMTGRDLSGALLPIHLESFLQSPAGYSYLAIPFMALFGLQEFAVRIPSALFGSLTIVLVYILVRQLFSEFRFANSLGLLSALILAISPWHINLSRVATENVLVVFFITLGVIFHLHWVKRKSLWLLIVSFICFSGTLLLYQAPRAFLPLFLPFLFFFFHPKPWKKHIVIPLVLFLTVIIIPTVFVIFSPDLSQRIRMLSIFHHPETQLVLNEQIREDGGQGSVYLTRLFHNKITSFSQTFLTNYFSHFSYDFLFTEIGLPDRYRVPQMGLLYLFEILFILLGSAAMLLQQRKTGMFLLMWILLAPLGTALTFDDVPNLQRTLIIFPALAIISAYGLLQLWLFISQRRFAIVFKSLIVLTIGYGLFYYLHQYYVHQNVHRPWYRQEGYKELVSQIENKKDNYKKVVITDEESAPAIFFLFYGAYDPKDLQLKLQQNPGKPFEQVAFKNYVFIHKSCPLYIDTITDSKTGLPSNTVRGEKNVLYVNSKICKQDDDRIRTISEIKRPDGSKVFTLHDIR